jgi:hypothetical protein
MNYAANSAKGLYLLVGWISQKNESVNGGVYKAESPNLIIPPPEYVAKLLMKG